MGFLPVVPNPKTDYVVLFCLAVDNLLYILTQLDKTSLIVTCDDGVYHKARQIKLVHPNKFKDLYICSLDMIPYPGCGRRSARAMSVGSRQRGL